MNKEIKEILELAKQLEDASNYKLADSLTASLLKLAEGRPTFKAAPKSTGTGAGRSVNITELLSAPSVKSLSSNPSSPFKSLPLLIPGNIEKFNKEVELIKLPENKEVLKSQSNERKRNDQKAKKATQVWKLVKKPNNIYYDYVVNSKDNELKDLNNKIKSFKTDDIEYYIRNINDISVFNTANEDGNKPKYQTILKWAFKMHIINSIPPAIGITGYSRSIVKPGQKEQDKKTTKTEIKTKTEGRSLPTTPTLPSAPEKEEETTRPVLDPDNPTFPKSPAITTPLESPVFPKEEYPDLLTPEIMTPITSPKRKTNEGEEEETSYGPMKWDEFLNFLNPNYTPGQAPTDTPYNVQDPLKVNINEPVGIKPPTSTSEQTGKNKEPSSAPKLFKIEPRPVKEAPAGGISFMRSFR
jgi:hypothetical protein